MMRDMTDENELGKRILEDLHKLEDEIKTFDDSQEKFDALKALERVRELLNLNDCNTLDS